MIRTLFLSLLLTAGTLAPPAIAQQRASIREAVRTIETYPFSDPDPVPMLTRDERLYPYHRFTGYSATSEPREWNVVTLENEYIQVFVLPEVGGKVWGAVIKGSGEEFIYRNEVMKFRNISLRGPWTSGGIEFNFGVIGHTPATATPVDYVLLENEDGSVSCVVGTMDLPSRTRWRVEIRLEPGASTFETNVLWHNPTPHRQPYYNWMTAAAFAQDDLMMAIPGDRFLGHPGESHAWPLDPEGHYLPAYRENRFGSNKSFHVVGEINDFFGGYYSGDGYGFGHWSRHEEMPGQKLWLWALSRQGGVWEDLLTDTDGQYVEYQAGRQHVQYSPGSDVNPIRQAVFEPGSTDRWSEQWYPVVGIGGLSDVSAEGVLHVDAADGVLEIGANAFRAAVDTLRIRSGDSVVYELPLTLKPVEAFVISWTTVGRGPYEVSLEGMGLAWSETPERDLDRPFVTDSDAMPSIPAAERQVLEADELLKARRLRPARRVLETVLSGSPWHRDALVMLAEIDLRQARYEEGLERVKRALQLNTYDAQANFVAGSLYRSLGMLQDARDAFGWAVRSMGFRSAGYAQLAEIALVRGEAAEAARYASMALDYDRLNLSALEIQALAARLQGDGETWEAALAALSGLDPLSHLVPSERLLAAPSLASRQAFEQSMRSEYPDQALLELVIGYASRGLPGDGAKLIASAGALAKRPLLSAWAHALAGTPLARLNTPESVDFTFPFRPESLPVLAQASLESSEWAWTYLYALNLWALGHDDDAFSAMASLGDAPTTWAFYAARAWLGEETAGIDPERDLLHAKSLDPQGRLSAIHLIQYYQARGEWQRALDVAEQARAFVPVDFDLDLLEARSHLNLGAAPQAVRLLESTHVLPSENASESHRFFEWAHLMEGLSAMESGDPETAARHFRRSLEWPEHLGQGRPYDPDERLPRYLLGLADSDDAQLRGVVNACDGLSGRVDPLHALGVAARAALGSGGPEPDWATAVPPPGDTIEGRLIKRALALPRGR